TGGDISGGFVTLSAGGTGTTKIATGNTVTGINSVTLIGHDMDLQGDVVSGAGGVTLKTNGAETVGIGTAVGNFTVDSTELTHIQSSGGVIINNSNAGVMTISGPVDLSSGVFGVDFGAYGLSLQNLDDVTMSGAISTPVLNVTSGGVVTLPGQTLVGGLV